MMNKNWLFIIPAGIALFVMAVINFIYTNNETLDLTQETSYVQREFIQININNSTIKAEVARTDGDKARGLMYRQSLNDNAGMLFIYPDEAERTFWMRNTYIPLDIIFIDKDKEIVSISSNTKPNQTEELYYSNGKSMYVLELNAGKAEALKVKPGNRITF